MKHLLKSLGIINDDFHSLGNVYEIRVKGLKEKLSNDELATAILHITKRRGSTIETADDTEEADKETGELKEILQANSKKLADGKFICEVQLELLNNGESIRGHHNNFKTKDYIKELKEILSHQELPEEACEAIVQIVSRKRAYYEGPGGQKSPTPYGRYIEANQKEPIDLIEKMRGKCSVVDGQEKRVMKFKDIYDPKFKNLAEDIVNGKAEDKYIMAKKDPATFEEIVRIVLNHYETFKDDPKQYVKDKKGVKLKGENPLTAYKEEFGKIRKFSKKGNGPEVTSIKCYYKTLGNYIDISKNYKLKQGKRVVLIQISPYRTDFYRDADGKIKMLTVRYKDISFKESLGLYCIDRDWYQAEKAKKKISDEAVFLCSLHHDELIGIMRKEGQKYIYDDSIYIEFCYHIDFC